MLKAAIKRNPFLFRTILSARNKISVLVPDKTYISRQYRLKTGKVLNLNHPVTFNEKLQWLKLNWRKNIFTACADKYEVRNYVETRVGKGILNELHGVYLRPESIELSSLPDKFVLKVTHGSGQNVICMDKSKLDWKKTCDDLKTFLALNHYYHGREWPYKNIPPRIVCEKYLEEDGDLPKDYKFFCFNGEPKVIQVDTGRFQEHQRNMYDTDWNPLNFSLQYPQGETVDKPSRLKEMLEYAKSLSEDMPFVRVDFYQVNDRVIFGEMTFFPENGNGRFSPDTYDALLGSYLKLPIN